MAFLLFHSVSEVRANYLETGRSLLRRRLLQRMLPQCLQRFLIREQLLRPDILARPFPTEHALVACMYAVPHVLARIVRRDTCDVPDYGRERRERAQEPVAALSMGEVRAHEAGGDVGERDGWVVFCEGLERDDVRFARHSGR